MKRLFLTLVLGLLGLATQAQSVVLTKPDSVYYFVNYTAAIEVTPGSVTIDSLLQHPQRYQFVSIRQKPIQSRSDRGYWFRVDLTNPRQSEVFIRNQFLNTVTLQFYEVADGRVINQYVQPFLLDKQTNPYIFAKRLWPLKLRPGQTHTLYLYAEGMYSPSPLLVAEPTLALLKSSLTQDVIFGLYYGINLIILLYSLLMFIRLGDRSYLYYALWIVAALPQTTHYYGHTATFLGKYYYWSGQYFPFASFISGSFHVLFTIHILQIRQLSRIVYRLGIGLIGFFVLQFVCTLLGYANPLGNGIILLTIYSLIAGIMAYRKGSGPAIYYLLGQLFLFGALYIGLGAVSGRLVINVWTAHSFLFGSVAEILFFTLALGNKISLIKKHQDEAIQGQLRLTKENQQLIETQNRVLEEKVEQRTAELRASQAQLIQKEKLASLGELTAGIAHEIQNPLNFVNNFSEVSTELVDELEEEADAGRVEEVKAIAGDLRQNLEKITLHGKRAGSIVRGMLEHSRASTGEKQPTNLNTLADEYLRLAYQGLRAKDQSFTCELKTDFAADLPSVSVVAQDIGRVLLNLYNNAFYAVHQRAQQAEAAYQPTVWVSTRQEPGRVVVCVRDNGMGIPDAIKEKIFQPFFTTKPTGEGTGLGLSLSYDIITKGHGGTMAVESREGEGTEFIIRLPL